VLKISFGHSIADFLTTVRVDIQLPIGFELLNPYGDAEVCRVVRAMCSSYYSGNGSRIGVWGINPGRFGAGVTGLSFTDPEALREDLGIDSAITGRREPSAEYVYKVIRELGGPSEFYRHFYLSALCPLGFVRNGVNINFYDDTEFADRLAPQIVNMMKTQIAFGLRTDRCVVLGTGKLRTFFEKVVRSHIHFERVDYLEHPRFIMQYKRKQIDQYVSKYVNVFAD
jgi:hypothetical protein